MKLTFLAEKTRHATVGNLLLPFKTGIVTETIYSFRTTP